MNAVSLRIKLNNLFLISLILVLTSYANLPNTNEYEELIVNYFVTTDSILTKQLDEIFSQEEIKDYLLCQKVNFDYTDNVAVKQLFSNNGLTILSIGKKEYLEKNIICTHKDIPDYIIKIYRPFANAAHSEDISLAERILYRSEISTAIEKLDLANIHVPEKYTYIFPWKNEIEEGAHTKPYLVLAKKITGTRFIEELSETEIEAIFKLAIETGYIDIRISNFVINEEGIWIIDTERHTHKNFKSSFTSVENAQIYYMGNFTKTINKLRRAPEKHPLDIQCVLKMIQSPDRNDTPCLECCS